MNKPQDKTYDELVEYIDPQDVKFITYKGYTALYIKREGFQKLICLNRRQIFIDDEGKSGMEYIFMDYVNKDIFETRSCRCF